MDCVLEPFEGTAAFDKPKQGFPDTAILNLQAEVFHDLVLMDIKLIRQSDEIFRLEYLPCLQDRFALPLRIFRNEFILLGGIYLFVGNQHDLSRALVEIMRMVLPRCIKCFDNVVEFYPGWHGRNLLRVRILGSLRRIISSLSITSIRSLLQKGSDSDRVRDST